MAEAFDIARMQKEALVQLRFLGDRAHKAAAVGRGTAQGALRDGVERRLLEAMRIVCAPSKKAMLGRSLEEAKVDAAAWLLLEIFLEASLASFDLGESEAQMLLSSRLTDEMRAAAQLRLGKMSMLEESFAKVQSATSTAASEAGLRHEDARAAFKQIMMELQHVG